MLFDPARHEPLHPLDWDEGRVRGAIQQIVDDAEQHFSPDRYWPMHPQDAESEDELKQVQPTLYFGACGVVWALHHLLARGAATLSRSYLDTLDALQPHQAAWLASLPGDERASYLMGDTPLLMLAQQHAPTAERAERIAALIAGNLDHPAREVLWGSPGTLLAALLMFENTGEARWAELFRTTAATLWSQLLWSDEHRCQYWTQDMYGQTSSYIDAVHGFVAVALPLIRGRQLLGDAAWAAWQDVIVTTIRQTVTLKDGLANWRAHLFTPPGRQPRYLMQFCHGAPGFVISLAGLPSPALDDLLLAGAEATWAAGPLTKGSNLCHGTGGNGYAFLKLYQRTGDARWLYRARAFAMHGIVQTETHARQYGQGRYSLWTGDPGFAIYLWDCLQGTGGFPTLELF
jgi:lantibiotic modifying enzyme